MRAVLDTYALIKWLLEEPGYEKIEWCLEESQVFMSTINFGETFYILIKRGLKEEAYTLWSNKDRLPIKFIPPSWKRIKLAAEIKASYPLSYADAFCAALAVEMKAPVITGDPEFKKIRDLQFIWVA